MTVNAPPIHETLEKIGVESSPPPGPGEHRGRRALRIGFVVLGLLALLAALGGTKFAQISKLIGMGKAMQAAGPPPETVSTAVAKKESWEATLSTVASLVSAKGVAVSADASGIVTRLHFDSGDSVKRGQILVELDTSVERAQLASLKAQRGLAETQLKRSKSLVAQGVIAQSELDANEASFQSLSAEANALSAQIAKKTIRAPFTGKLGIREVNLGQYLAPGTTIASLETSDAIFADFTLPQRELERLSPGLRVRATSEGGAEAVAEGEITAIEPGLNPVTRNVSVRASLPNPGDALRPGMFVEIAVILPAKKEVVVIPKTAVVHASYGDSVFLVDTKPVGAEQKPGKVAQQAFIKLGESRGDFVAVVGGLKDGQEIVTAGAFKLRNGIPLTISDAVEVESKLNPKPANR